MDILKFLYHTVPGRLLLKPLTSPRLSKVIGWYLDRPASRWLIPVFVRNSGIDLSEYEADHFQSFNDCFCRRIKEEYRPYEMDAARLVSPCDGLLSAWTVDQGLVLPIKQSQYTVKTLLQDEALARKYEGGLVLVFRLCVDNYHRYAYVESGQKTADRVIPGVLHTVRPVALSALPVFHENSREYTVIETENMGSVVQMEVGAMLVGRIQNFQKKADSVMRGQEKGTFLYGGSTIIVLIEKDQVRLQPEILKRSMEGEELPVRMGQVIGEVQ